MKSSEESQTATTSLGRVALLAVNGGTVLRDDYSPASSSWKRMPIPKLNMTQGKDGTHINVGPLSASGAKILAGENSLVCSLLSWREFPDELKLSIRDNGDIDACGSLVGCVGCCVYRVHRGEDELLLVDRKGLSASSICTRLGIETTARITAATFFRDPDRFHIWTSDWCVGGHVPCRDISKRIMDATGIPDVLSYVITEYYNRGEYVTDREYRMRVAEAVAASIRRDLVSGTASVQLVPIYIDGVYSTEFSAEYDRVLQSASREKWMNGLRMPFAISNCVISCQSETIGVYVYRRLQLRPEKSKTFH